MLLIENKSSIALQQQDITLENGEVFSLTLYFRPMQRAWFIKQLVFGDFEVNEIALRNSLNVLQQFKNVLPFGICCRSIDSRDPSLQQDFVSGHSSLYLLTSDELKELSEHYAYVSD